MSYYQRDMGMDGFPDTTRPKTGSLPRGKHYAMEATELLLARRALVGIKKRRRAAEPGKGFIDDSVPWNRNNEYGLQAITFSQAGGVNTSKLIGALRANNYELDSVAGKSYIQVTTNPPLGMRNLLPATLPSSINWIFPIAAPPRGIIQKLQLTAKLISVGVPATTQADIFIYTRMSAADLAVLLAGGVGEAITNEAQYIAYWVTGMSVALAGATPATIIDLKEIGCPYINEQPLAKDQELPPNELYVRIITDGLSMYAFNTKMWIEDYGELEIAGVG